MCEGPGPCPTEGRPSCINNTSTHHFLKIKQCNWHPCFFESLSLYAKNLNLKPWGEFWFLLKRLLSVFKLSDYPLKAAHLEESLGLTVQVTAHRPVGHHA